MPVTRRTALLKAAPMRAAIDGLRWETWAAARPADLLRKRPAGVPLVYRLGNLAGGMQTDVRSAQSRPHCSQISGPTDPEQEL